MTDQDLLNAAKLGFAIVGGHGAVVEYRPDDQERYPWRDRHGRYWPAWLCFPKRRRVRHV